MLKRKERMIALLASLAMAVSLGAEQSDNNGEKKDRPAEQVTGELPGVEAPFEVRGTFDLGFRWRDTTGNEDKYFEDINLRTGPRLFNLNIDVTPIGSGFFDVLNVQAANLGGDPFESFGITLKNYEKYDFRYTRNKATYFYRDTLVPVEEADVRLSEAGDFVTFNFDRTFDLFDFNFRPSQKTTVFVKFNRQSRNGESTDLLDISRDEFELDRPLDEIKNDYTIGFQLKLDRASFYFDETYRDYENNRHLFLPGASLGENPTNTTELFFFEQIFPYDFKMPQSTVRVNVRPDDRLTVNGSFIYSALDADLSLEETTRGIAFNGAPIDTRVTGSGAIDRTMKIGDFDFAYRVIDEVDIIGGARFDRFDQTADFTEGDVGMDTTLDIALDLYEVGLRVTPNALFSVSGGARFESRDTIVVHEEGPDEHPATDRKTFFLNGVVSPSTKLNVLAEYERGDYDNPFTLVSPTSQNRAKLRVRARPIAGLSVIGSFLLRNIDNEISGGAVDSTVFSGYASYDVAGWSVFGSYSRQELTNDITNQVSTVGFGGGATFLWSSFYESNVDMGTGGVRYAFSERLTAGTEMRVYRNRGSFGLDWRQYRVFGDFTAPAGYLIRLTYQRSRYDEVIATFDDYDANLFTVSLGYRF